jgi:6-pyruvoyltetrahydropterin/6-carboxytetrahydropterin synthase
MKGVRNTVYYGYWYLKKGNRCNASGISRNFPKDGDRMYEIRVEAEFAAAHFLRDYNGKCENLHGHNYKVFAHVKGASLDSGGMLLDFSKLKKALRTVCKTLDHTNLNDMAVFNQNPSAERIAKYIYDVLIAEMQDTGINLTYTPDKKNLVLSAVDVFETDTSRARYSPAG